MKFNHILRKQALAVLIFAALPFEIMRAEIHQPFMQIPFVKTPPVIDGKLNDASWQKSVELSDFVIWSLDSYTKDSVIVYMCYDEKNLYVAFRNYDPAAGDLNQRVSSTRPRDTFLWGRNFTMVRIENKGISIQLMGDPKQTMTDFKNNDINWNGKWQFAASINQKDWTSEFSIPFSELGIDNPSSIQELTVGLSRSFPTGEAASWGGICKLAGPANATYQYGRWPEPVPGKNSLAFTAHNYGTEKLNVQCELELIPLNDKPEFINQAGQGPSSDLQLHLAKEPLTFKHNYTIAPGVTLKEKISYELPFEGSYYASATIKSKEGTIMRRSVDFWFTIEPDRQKLKSIKERLGESLASMKRVSNPVAGRLRSEGINMEQTLKQIEGSAESAWNSGKWSEFTDQVEKTDQEVTQFLHKVKWSALNNWGHEDDFGIALTHSIIKLRRDDLFPLPLNEQIDVSLALNEYESFQLAILPFGRDINQLKVEVSDLKDNRGNAISKNNIELSLVEYNKIDWQPDYLIAYKGWHPDPLIPLTSPVSINGSEICSPVWITIYAPAGTAAGEYTGTVAVSASGMKQVNAVVKCRVWDFEIPMVSHLKTHSWDDISTLGRFYNKKEFPIEWYHALLWPSVKKPS